MHRLPDAQATKIADMLQSAMARQLPISCRAEGMGRSLAKLYCHGAVPGQYLDLGGFANRDRMPRPGLVLHLAIRAGEYLYFMKAPVRDNLHSAGRRILRLDWPVFSAEPQRRELFAAAAYGLPALPALVWFPGEWLEAHLFDLNGSFADLGLAAAMPLELRQRLEVQTLLPDGRRLAMTGEVLRFAWAPGNIQPMRFRVTLERLAVADQEVLCRFLLGRSLTVAGRVHAHFRLDRPAPPAA